WLVLGTAPFDKGNDPFADAPPGGLLSEAPDEGDLSYGMAWKLFESTEGGQLDLIGRGYEQEEYVSAYLHAYVFSSTERTMTLWVGSDDGIQVFVNGTEVHRNWVLRGWKPDQDRFRIRLGAGWNRLLVRVSNYSGGFGASARLLDAEGLRSRAARPDDYAPVRTPPFIDLVESRIGPSLVKNDAGALELTIVTDVRNLGTEPAAGAALHASSDDGGVDVTRTFTVQPGSSELVLPLEPIEVARTVASGSDLLMRLDWTGEAATRGLAAGMGPRDVLRVVIGDPPLRESLPVDSFTVARFLDDWSRGERFRPDLLDGEESFRDLLDAFVRGDDEAFRSGWVGLERQLEQGAEAIKRHRITFVGNSHIDMAWLWDRDETIEVVDMTYDQALKFVDEFPFFNYAQSQMQTYAWVESLFPEMMQRIDAAVEAGRWIPVGGMWVEPDCNLPSGESFVRQLLYGKGWIRDRYGIDIRVGWNPDSFGYSRTLPMIFKGAGIDYFITQKIGWNDTTEFPHRLFWWEAPDGSRVLSYFPFTYVDDARPEVLAERLIDQQDQQPGLEDMLNLYGVGDHGGGPTREMIQRYIAMSTLKTFPTVEHATPISFMERVEDKYQGRIPVWKDELYLEYHRGTFTTQAEIKRRNRRMESALESAEKFATVAEALVEDYRYPDEWLDGAWLRTLFNQFHDILPGSSIPDVYEDARADFDEAESFVESAGRGALEVLADRVTTNARKGVPVVVFNPLSWSRSEVVSVPLRQLRFEGESFEVTDSTGTAVPAQPSEDGLLFLALDVPGIGYRTFWVRRSSGPIDETDLAAEKNGDRFLLLNNKVRAEIDARTGDLRSVVLLPSGGEMLAPQGGNVLQLFGDEPDMWDAWNIG
ncbi:MAG: alpha-mannosidase, partial [Planctomycetota bacterium]